MIKPHCSICGNANGNSIFVAREMMLGFKTEFEYLECNHCGCLQLVSQPDDIAKYYPKDYYSYQSGSDAEISVHDPVQKFKRKVRGLMLDAYLNRKNVVGKLFDTKYRSYYSWMLPDAFSTNSKILDIGCGSGELLKTMYQDGFKNLTGLDPYIEDDIELVSGIKIHKKNPEELKEQFDVIMMHHAFEHMDNPLSVLKKMNHILHDEGLLIIRIPVADSYAWNTYRENWVQLDAPRHAFLHTRKSMEILSRQSGFEICSVHHDSYEFQFTGSEKYKRGIPLTDDIITFSEEKIREFRDASLVLNERNEGDQACFYLRKVLMSR